MSDKQVKSKARVAKHGEVFTNPREVNAMLDLVQDQITRIDATFLEPACGSGNFLVEILRRRMAYLNQKYKTSLIQYQPASVQAVCGLYGIELLADNAAECRERLLETFAQHYSLPFQTAQDYPRVLDTVFAQFTRLPLGVKLPPYFDLVHFDQMAAILNRYPLAYVNSVNSIGNGLLVNPHSETVLIKPKHGLGGIGGTGFTPIVNAPEVAILGVCKSQIKPVWNGKEFAPRLMCPLSLSFDHRVIDGAAGMRFTVFLANLLKDFRRVVL